MKERPILFKSDMVNAILDGWKTQTRRIPKPHNCLIDGRGRKKWPKLDWSRSEIVEQEDIIQPTLCVPYIDPVSKLDFYYYITPRAQVGDHLWVRENWASEEWYDHLKPSKLPRETIFYRASCPTDRPAHTLNIRGKWRPSIHMPRWVSRITLKVKDVRVERVQGISEEDARAEGIIDGGCLNCGESEPCKCSDPCPDTRESFIYLWDTLNKKRGFGWDANPWVWVIEFERIE